MATSADQVVLEAKRLVRRNNAVKGRWGRAAILIVRRDGRLRLRAEHLDIFSRYMYPVAYAIFIAVTYAQLDGAKDPMAMTCYGSA